MCATATRTQICYKLQEDKSLYLALSMVLKTNHMLLMTKNLTHPVLGI